MHIALWLYNGEIGRFVQSTAPDPATCCGCYRCNDACVIGPPKTWQSSIQISYDKQNFHGNIGVVPVNLTALKKKHCELWKDENGNCYKGAWENWFLADNIGLIELHIWDYEYGKSPEEMHPRQILKLRYLRKGANGPVTPVVFWPVP